MKKEFMIHISKTGRHRNIKILVSVAVICKLKLLNQDVNQAYIEENNLERDLYVIHDKRLGLQNCTLLKLSKPLHGLTELGV